MLAVRNRFMEAVEMVRAGRYFDAHEAFETLWREAEGPDREYYRGWVLLSAALFHRDRGNPTGSRLCFERAAAHWQKLPARVRGTPLAETLKAFETVLEREWVKPDLSFVAPVLGGAPSETD
ncbi:MAG: hypothetical protein Kow0092_25650 [Deferrisomatales bacterium]